MPEPGEEQRAERRRALTTTLSIATTCLFLLGVLWLQWQAAQSLFGSSLQGDEARHYTNGVLVYDYVRAGLPRNPIQFAESFYVRYPQVSIGHWPPMYYAIQALFYFVTGPFIRSAQILSALTALCLALLLYRSLRDWAGAPIALISTGTLPCNPPGARSTWTVMSDLLTGLFIYLALVAFASLLDGDGCWKAATRFSVWGHRLRSHKGSAWALIPFFLSRTTTRPSHRLLQEPRLLWRRGSHVIARLAVLSPGRPDGCRLILPSSRST
jgi:hypothetical protein